MARIFPNKICVRCTPLSAIDKSKNPRLKNIIYIADKLESSGKLDFFEIHRLSRATRIPAIIPPTVMPKAVSPLIMNAAAIPGKIPCDRASPISPILLSTINKPKGVADKEREKLVMKAFLINSYFKKGLMTKSYKQSKSKASSVVFKKVIPLLLRIKRYFFVFYMKDIRKVTADQI